MRRWLNVVKNSLVVPLIICIVILLSNGVLIAQSKWEVPVLKQPPLQLLEKSESQVEANPEALNDPRDLENLIDSIVAGELDKSETPGVVISVVKDGKIFFAKGYGYADIDQKTPVDADRTLFRVASLSKLLTITGAMQLYQRGLIEINDDVSQYLDFALDNPYSAPVTFGQIMTHTDGTTKRRLGLAARTEAELEPLGKHLPDHLPEIFWPPGELYSYSSYSIALLGYLVERVANTPFIEYIEQNILQPLDMQRSTFRQPPPPSLRDDLAVGYQKQGNKFQPVPYLYLNIYPGASFQTTAIDMAHFMITHLQLGRYQDQRILDPEVAKLMHVTHFTNYPGLPGTSYGFREQFINNIRTIGHLGSLRGYSSSLNLLPEQNIGIFVASNSFTGIHGQILRQFFDRYFPVVEDSTVPPVPKNLDLSKFTGYYRDLEYPRNTLAKLSGVFKYIQVVENQDQGLTIHTPNLFFVSKIPSKHLVPIDGHLFRRVEDNALTAFQEGTKGKIFSFNPLFPKIGGYVKIAWYENILVQVALVGFCCLFFLTSSIAWLIRPLIQRLRDKKFHSHKQLGWALITAGLVGLFNLIFFIGLPLYLWLIGPWKLAYGVPAIAIAFLCLPLVSTTLTIILLITTLFTWIQGSWNLGQRLHYSLVTLASLFFIVFLIYWNLLGFQF